MIYVLLLMSLAILYILLYAIVAILFATKQVQTNAKLGVVFNHRLRKNGILSETSVMRLEHCAYSYKLGKFDKVFPAGGYNPDDFVFSSEINAHFLIESGVEPEDIHEVSYSFNTWTNCTEALDFMREFKYGSAIFISSPIHLFRIAMILKKIGKTENLTFSSPDLFSWVSTLGLLTILREVIEESIKILTLLLPAGIYRKFILESFQSGKLGKFRRISKF